ncbi:hypothetical protein CAPTEDRAFT_188320 [Capitella teleta]|uniref:Uncharacterized protein n=1 Tax=Capitella teleta TaxID=283909 RepID=R7VIM9_CAPTE|nr:hypothetical protein CAPTEDRAFT_188320 [Capitella teleta]|eukprot:ELU18484.1 hypothetical protein CAPTEDRAFT_188320 [Capitella teleta]
MQVLVDESVLQASEDWLQRFLSYDGAGYVREKDIGAFQEAIAAMTGDQHVFKRNLQAIIQRTMKSPQRPVHSAILANWRLFTVSSSRMKALMTLAALDWNKQQEHAPTTKRREDVRTKRNSEEGCMGSLEEVG